MTTSPLSDWRGRMAGFLAGIIASPSVARSVFLLILLLCAFGNLPWHLDNYDQAKQAYVSYEISHGGNWWFQHTPRGDTATKPPLAGWISLGFHAVSGSWDIAWRLPGWLCAVALIFLLAREGRAILPSGGALLVIAAFGLNLLTPRIATLVRTDMMLTLWITLCGWLIYRKVSSGEPWRIGEKWAFFAAMLAACLTKGPIIYAFLLPGMAAFWFLAPRDRRHLIWSGWWTWLIPLALFVLWGVMALVSNPSFYQDVIVTEFFSRFDQSLKSHEKQQPIWFYFPHLIHKFAPWSLLVLALPVASANVRRRIKEDPGLLWLTLWAVGGLLCMTFIPSKRVDRIYPVIPPFCLMLAGMVAACQCGRKVRAWCGASLIAALCMTVGYFLTIIVAGYLEKADAMPRWGRAVQAAAAQTGATRIAVVEGRDEGMVIYCGGASYFRPGQALEAWRKNEIDALVIPARRLEDQKDPPPLPAPALEGVDISKDDRKERYLFFLRAP